ncbi:MAG: DUF2225 domain-containing protein [candidate division Zixibacteria bacterium]|nr:DUF2225 domain-containing protein [candidate division Zixibacteria bacterium]
MATESPFLLFRVECPICKQLNEFETIRVGAYAEEGRDTDFCPTNVKWRFPRYQGYNPLVFFIATCGNCHYSREFSNTYRDWKSDTNFKTYRLKTVKPKHLDLLATTDSALKLLGEAVDVNRYPNEAAILKLHLAIFDEQLADHYSRLDVGRFYLRIAWVYRDLESGENPSRQLIKGLLHEIEAEFGQTRNAVTALQRQLGELNHKITSHFDAPQLSAEFRSQMLSFRDRYEASLQTFNLHSQSFDPQLDGLRSLLDEYRRAVVGGSEGSSQATFGKYPSFHDYLASVKRQWSGIVTNEREALEMAVYFYKEAFANGHDIAPGNQQIQASYLIAELSRRIGDYDEAKQYFTSTIKSGQEFIYQNRQDPSRVALAKKILELAIEQGRNNLAASRPA